MSLVLTDRIISQPAFASVMADIKSELQKSGVDLTIDELPSLQQIFPDFGPSGDAKVHPFPAAEKRPAPEDIVLYLHSSGSTGFPKPIPQRQVTVLEWCNGREYW